VPRSAIAPLGLTTEGSTKFKLKGWKCHLKKLQCTDLVESSCRENLIVYKYFQKSSFSFCYFIFTPSCEYQSVGGSSETVRNASSDGIGHTLRPPGVAKRYYPSVIFFAKTLFSQREKNIWAEDKSQATFNWRVFSSVAALNSEESTTPEMAARFVSMIPVAAKTGMLDIWFTCDVSWINSYKETVRTI